MEKGKQNMDDKFKVFNSEEFGDVRVIVKDGNPWFVGKDVSRVLKYSDVNKAIAMHVDDDDKLNDKSSPSFGQRGAWIINESGLYSLVLSSKMPDAKKFKQWITHEVIPMIRETGGYIETDREEEFINMYFPAFSEETKLAMVLDLREQNVKLKATVTEQKPLVEFASHVSDTEDLVTVAEFAKMMNGGGIPLGRNKMYDWLRENEYVRENREPYQRHVDAGLFKVRETVKESMYGSKVFPQTFITGKGQLHLTKKLREAFGV